MNGQNENNIYTIPPNFIGASTLFGGMFKMRNTVEAAVISAIFGTAVFMIHSLSLKMKIIIFCITGLPIALLALMGISGESLSSFVLGFLRFLKNRRIITAEINGEKQSRATRKASTAVLPYLNPVAQYLLSKRLPSVLSTRGINAL